MRTSEITYVTGLWNLTREGRDFEEWYLPAYEQLLSIDVNFYIYGPSDLQDWVWERRSKENTVYHVMDFEDIKQYYGPHWDNTQRIRQDPEWYNQAEWLKTSPQAVLEYYNPIVQSKLPWTNDVALRDPFQSKFFYWIDAGLTRTVSYELLNSGVLNNTGREGFIMLAYPHTADTEIHGFEREAIAKYCNTDFVDYVCRGGFFGGNKFMLSMLNGIYYNLLKETLAAGYMGVGESILTIMHHLHPDLIYAFPLGGGGVQPYFEYLRDKPSVNHVNLYILSYNTPKQVECLVESMQEYDSNFLTDPKIILVDNSDDPEVEPEYAAITEKYGWERIKLDNLGVTGGRKYVAEHFDKSDADLCIYFEDDMLFYPGDQLDSSGFIRKVKDLYNTVVAITRLEKFDFLKFSFAEYFAINTTNTAWHNSSAELRQRAWPGLKGGPPFTQFKHIKSLNGIPYANGDVFYANWPHIMTKSGSSKLFLENPYLEPAEWTVMAYGYELWLEGKLNPAVLLASTIEHNRVHDYDRAGKSPKKEF